MKVLVWWLLVSLHSCPAWGSFRPERRATFKSNLTTITLFRVGQPNAFSYSGFILLADNSVRRLTPFFNKTLPSNDFLSPSLIKCLLVLPRECHIPQISHVPWLDCVNYSLSTLYVVVDILPLSIYSTIDLNSYGRRFWSQQERRLGQERKLELDDVEDNIKKYFTWRRRTVQHRTQGWALWVAEQTGSCQTRWGVTVPALCICFYKIRVVSCQSLSCLISDVAL